MTGQVQGQQAVAPQQPGPPGWMFMPPPGCNPMPYQAQQGVGNQMAGMSLMGGVKSEGNISQDVLTFNTTQTTGLSEKAMTSLQNITGTKNIKTGWWRSKPKATGKSKGSVRKGLKSIFRRVSSLFSSKSKNTD